MDFETCFPSHSEIMSRYEEICVLYMHGKS